MDFSPAQIRMLHALKDGKPDMTFGEIAGIAGCSPSNMTPALDKFLRAKLVTVRKKPFKDPNGRSVKQYAVTFVKGKEIPPLPENAPPVSATFEAGAKSLHPEIKRLEKTLLKASNLLRAATDQMRVLRVASVKERGLLDRMKELGVKIR